MQFKHAKIRKNSKFIQVQACMNGIRYRFSTNLAITKENLEYVELHHKELIYKHEMRLNKKAKIHENHKNNPYTLGSYGYKVLELERFAYKESTLIRYNNVFKKHIVANIGNMLIKDFSPKVIKEIFATKLNSLSYTNQGIALVVLKRIFNNAIADEIYSNANPINCIKRKRIQPKVQEQNKPFILEESMQILSLLDSDNSIDTQVKLYLQIALLTGMRIGEILALRYEDIDLKHNCISVYKTLSNGKITTTKTNNGTREVEIIESLKPALIEALHTNKSGYIFVNNHDKFISRPKITKTYKEILIRLDIKQRTLYSTRHTFASLSLTYGEDLLWVSNMLGHKDISTTCKSYARYIKQEKKRATFFNLNERKTS